MSGRGRTLAIGWVVAIAASLAFASAGRWQLGRMHEKQAMLARADQALSAARPQPLLLASVPSRTRDYDLAAGRGDVVDATFWLDNQLLGGRPGVRMYCVLLPDQGVQALLLDAGWWPIDGQRTLPSFGCPRGAGVEVRGLLVAPPSVGLARGEPLAPSGDRRWLATRLAAPEIAAALQLRTGVAPRVLRLDPARRPGDAGVMLAPGERDLEILPNTLPPQRHLGYAVQWFALALAVLVAAGVLTWKRGKH
jgi:cytochrome oxidase assembly protein ShyY1